MVLNVPSSRLNWAAPALSTDSGPIIINSHRTAIGSDMTSAPLRVSGAAAASEGQVSEDRCRPVRLGYRRQPRPRRVIKHRLVTSGRVNSASHGEGTVPLGCVAEGTFSPNHGVPCSPAVIVFVIVIVIVYYGLSTSGY